MNEKQKKILYPFRRIEKQIRGLEKLVEKTRHASKYS